MVLRVSTLLAGERIGAYSGSRLALCPRLCSPSLGDSEGKSMWVRVINSQSQGRSIFSWILPCPLVVPFLTLQEMKHTVFLDGIVTDTFGVSETFILSGCDLQVIGIQEAS